MISNTTLLSPIEQLKLQDMSLRIETDELRFLDEDFSLFENEEINIDVNLEIKIEYHPDYGKSVKELKVKFLNAYDNRECEDLFLIESEKKEIAKYLKENLNIEIQ